jgi:hypothetical protein
MDLQVIAGLHADIETLAALQQLGMSLNDTVVEAVALSGRLNILQHLLTEQQCPVTDTLSHYAARSANISMLKWLRSDTQCVFDGSTCAGAAIAGHLAALQHLRSEGCYWDGTLIGCNAASSGSIEVVEWLQQQQGVHFGASAMAAAARAEHVAMCEHLRSMGCDWDTTACTRAATCGRLDTLRWLRENGCSWNVQAICMYAADNGFTNILDYVIEQGEVLDAKLLRQALNAAGASGHLRAAQWLRQHGAQWPAVLGNNEDQHWSGGVVAWARALGCTAPVATYDDMYGGSDNDSE